MRLCVFLFFLLFFQTEQLLAKKVYSQYYAMVNSAEEAFVDNNINTCYNLYDSAFKAFDSPFVKDIYVAAQIAYWHGDTVVFLHYLEVAFNEGMPLECVNIAPMFKNIKDNPSINSRINALYERRLPFKIDDKIKDEIYTIKHRESTAHDLLNGPYNKENVANMKKVNNENVTAIIKYLDKGIWPSEKIIGIYTDKDYELFLDKHKYSEKHDDLSKLTGIKLTPIPSSYSLYNESAHIPLLHDPCRFSEIKGKLFKMVEIGLLHPGDYALFEEWSFHANRVDEKYTTLCPVLVKRPLYNILGDLEVSDEAGKAQVEKNRKDIGLQKYSVDNKKRVMQQKFGFCFFYGFFESR